MRDSVVLRPMQKSLFVNPKPQQTVRRSVATMLMNAHQMIGDDDGIQDW